jgi:hypothetical protein
MGVKIPIRGLLLAALLAFAIAATARPGHAQAEGSAPFSSTGTSAEAIDHFLDRLRAALAKNDRASVATMVDYPLRAWDGRSSVKIKSRSTLLKDFDRIFDGSLRKTIQDASSRTAWANWQGVMFDDGRMWIRPVPPKDELRIVTINQPVGPDAP